MSTLLIENLGRVNGLVGSKPNDVFLPQNFFFDRFAVIVATQVAFYSHLPNRNELTYFSVVLKLGLSAIQPKSSTEIRFDLIAEWQLKCTNQIKRMMQR